MEKTATNKIVSDLREGFKQKENATLAQRLYHLNLLEKVVRNNENKIIEAIQKDFNKPEFETFLTELFPFYLEIKHFRKKLKKYMRPKSVGTPLPLLPASGKIYYEPKGVVLIIGAWNYPINLTFIPLVGALASGNTVLLKPSENTPHTAAIIHQIISEVFSPHVLKVVEGDGAFTSELLEEKFNHIFYTGSTQVGRIVYEKAAKQLCPVTLELGGKSPAIFGKSINLDKSVKRLIWGKIVNAGQTCVAPDYALIPIELKDQFLEKCKLYLQKFTFSEKAKQTKIVNERHFNRIVNLMQGAGTVHFGGESDSSELWIAPTIIEIPGLDNSLMQEEIFGPVLPVYFYKNPSEIKAFYANNPDPLALYIFSTDKIFTEEIIANYPSGGVLINDVMMHLAHEGLPFGGRGNSGFGHYHGKASFECFSHTKSVMKQVNWIDPSFRYPEYTPGKMNFLRKVLQFLR